MGGTRSLLGLRRTRPAVFIWIPRCAGGSIAAVCHQRGILVDPVNVEDLSGTPYANAEDHGDHFRFTFVRNPWDRIVSAYAMFTGRRRPQWIPPMSLREFLEICAREPLRKRPYDEEVWLRPSDRETLDREEIAAHYRRSIRNHTGTVFDPFYKVFDERGNPVVDFIGRFERLRRDFRRLRRRLRMGRARLPHRDRGRHAEYTTYYDAETRRMVGDLFAEEIDYFGYSFGK
jgi:hypothetical protein